MEIARLHVIIDVSPAAPDPVGLARCAVAGGAELVQIRCKGISDRSAYELSASIAELCRDSGVACVVNDRADLAVAVAANGCHVGQEDLPLHAVRQVVGRARIVGGTARDPLTGLAHERAGADYLGVGPIYATTSKTGLPQPLGVAALGEVCAAVSIPVIAISGVTVDRVDELVGAGAHGVAVIAAIARASDPKAATAAFVAALARVSAVR